MRLILLALLVGACGEIKAEKADAAIDADLLDADLSAPLNVITQAHVQGPDAIGAPVPNIQVISILPNGDVEDMAMSDATGHATLKVFPGGSVTAIYPHTVDMGADLVTYFAVKPGDTLTFGQRFPQPQGTSLGSMVVSWPTLPAATNGYEIFAPCSGNFFNASLTSGTIAGRSDCATSPYFAVFLAFDSNGITGFNSTQATQFQAGGSLSIGGWATAQQATVNISNLPPEVQGASVNFSVVSGIAQLFNSGTSGVVTGGAFSGNFKWSPVGDRNFVQLFVNRTGGFNGTVVLDALPPNALTYTVADAKFPPWNQASFVACAARTGIWFPIATDAAKTLDGSVTQVNWNHQVTMGGTTTNNQFNWFFINPPEATAFNFPKLPAQFADDFPHDEDFCNGFTRLISIPSASGYDAFRAVPERNLVSPEAAVREGEIQRMIVND